MEEDEVVGIDATHSRLWCQVKHGKPEMKVDDENRLRHLNWPEGKTSLYLGDICDALLRCFGAHEPPTLTSPPGFDQQTWKMVTNDSLLRIEITSRSYWGFGLFDSCFLNELVIEGPLENRARLIFDLVATLGRNPWEPTFGLMWKRATGTNSNGHREAWEGLIQYAREEMNEEAHKYKEKLTTLTKRLDEFEEMDYENWQRGDAENALEEASGHIDIALAALHDKNAAAFERALARAEASMIEADPTTEITRTVFQEADDLLLDDSLEIKEEEYQEHILVHEELPDEVDRITPDEVATKTSDVSADDLLGDITEESGGDIPFIDLTDSEE
uniref:Uncharacterized protein n=1 Tax=uncultured marine group II/III euryarchaeote KM3_192_B10 TaxID=1457963 RepID=A0A075GRS6_9EURY|nr:hypothetical protein [uncultured marine group II/III euryarchaeote KM3_192_B10]